MYTSFKEISEKKGWSTVKDKKLSYLSSLSCEQRLIKKKSKSIDPLTLKEEEKWYIDGIEVSLVRQKIKDYEEKIDNSSFLWQIFYFTVGFFSNIRQQATLLAYYDLRTCEEICRSNTTKAELENAINNFQQYYPHSLISRETGRQLFSWSAYAEYCKHKIVSEESEKFLEKLYSPSAVRERLEAEKARRQDWVSSCLEYSKIYNDLQYSYSKSWEVMEIVLILNEDNIHIHKIDREPDGWYVEWSADFRDPKECDYLFIPWLGSPWKLSEVEILITTVVKRIGFNELEDLDNHFLQSTFGDSKVLFHKNAGDNANIKSYRGDCTHGQIPLSASEIQSHKEEKKFTDWGAPSPTLFNCEQDLDGLGSDVGITPILR